MSEESSEDHIKDSAGVERFSIDERFDFRLPETARGDDMPVTDSEGPIEPEPTLAGRVPDSTDEVDPLLGMTIGNYEIQRELGRGGFGTVYKALDIKLDRPAALKFLRFPLDRQHRELFVREAKVIANLSKHPSIVQIYAWGEFRGSYYFALEYLDMSAEKLLNTTPGAVPVAKALRIVSSCASGLQYAHDHGVLHRDIKPGNILIDRTTEQAKLCDFGLAKFHSMGSGTKVSTLAGSPAYMAPEQISGGKISARTDVYSLGVTLYEMLSGRLPCEGDSHGEILEQVRKGASTPLKNYRPDLPPAILDIVRKSTAYRAEDRYQSADEMREAIESILQSLESSGSARLTPETAKPKHLARTLKIGTALVASAALVFFGWILLPGTGDTGHGSSALWPPALADAKTQIEEGAYEEAERELEDYLVQRPDDEFAQYAMGYVQLKTSRGEDAAVTFGLIPTTGLREEGLAAVAHASEGELARGELERVEDLVPTGYASVLLAALDVSKREYEAVIARLDELNKAALLFDWQRRQYARLLGQAYYKTGDLAAAKAAFLLLPENDTFAAGYLELARREDERAERVALNKQIDEVAEMWEAMGIEGRQDTWTSRPFAIELKESSAAATPLAISLGMPDLLPIGLSNSVQNQSDVPLAFVNRKDISHILQELRISGMLSGVEDGLQAQRVIGARLLMQAEYKRLRDRDVVEVSVTDVETTRRVLYTVIDFDLTYDQDELATTIVETLVDKLRDQYPIQGILRNVGGTPKLNVGALAGARTGMVFDIRPTQGAAPITGKSAVATDRIGDKETTLRLSELEVGQIPEGGLFVREMNNP